MQNYNVYLMPSPISLRKAKTLRSFGLSECYRIKRAVILDYRSQTRQNSSTAVILDYRSQTRQNSSTAKWKLKTMQKSNGNIVGMPTANCRKNQILYGSPNG